LTFILILSFGYHINIVSLFITKLYRDIKCFVQLNKSKKLLMLHTLLGHETVFQIFINNYQECHLLIWSSLNNCYNVFNYCVCNNFLSQEVQLLTVLHILMTLYQDVNATEVQDEKLAKFRRKVLSTAIKDNINEVWSILHDTLTVSGLPIRTGQYYFQSWYLR